MPKIIDVPANVRPFLFHGLDLDWEGRTHAVGECPFCGREGKFTVSINKGTWGCFVCGVKGNPLTFLRQLWEESDKATNGQTTEFAVERGLLHPETLTAWGVVQSIVDGSWLVPGRLPDGKIGQLYKRIRAGERWEMRPTPGFHHQLHFMDKDEFEGKGTIYLHESWGNALAFWEVARCCKQTDRGLVQTGSETSSLLADAAVLSMPNCGAVGEPLKKYLHFFAGKRVVLMFDSDHPKEVGGRPVAPAGWSAMRRATGILAFSGRSAKEVLCLNWGPDGFDPDQKSGWDVRDVLSQGKTLQERISMLARLLGKVEPIPEDWLPGRTAAVVKTGGTMLEPSACSDWATLINSWRKAMRMRPDLIDVLAVMMAVACSTVQVGDQLFLQVIGEAGSGKTRFCDGMLTSQHCYALEHLTGFHSGWKGSKEDGEGDYSLLARINYKTLITPEGDVMMSNPRFQEIMSQQRRIFDGVSGASYKNRKEDMRYAGLRTPWIMAGTLALLDTDQSRLGDRFLRICMSQPDEAEKDSILQAVGFSALRSVRQTSDGTPDSTLEESLSRAYRLTGGYVDWLRANVEEKLCQLDIDEAWLVDACATLGKFTADLRARPDGKQRQIGQEHSASKEMPTRLTHQFVRLAVCLAVVLNKQEVDTEVLRKVCRVALDTSRGRTMDITRHLHDVGQEGATSEQVARWTGHPEGKERLLLHFLRRIDVAECFQKKASERAPTPRPRWRLTERFQSIWEGVMNHAKG